MRPQSRLFAFISIVVLLSLGNLFFVLSDSAHQHIGCPFFPGQEVACSAPLEHLEHWQSSFLSFLTNFVLLFMLAFSISQFLACIPSFEKQRFRLRFSKATKRPMLLQELFARGILNPKLPEFVS